MPDLTPDVERELDALDDALAGRRVASDLAELAELAVLLRDDRPAPDGDFGRDLDRRAAHGFRERDPRAPASRPRRLVRREWMAPALGVTATALLIAIVAIAAPGDDDMQGAGPGAPVTDSAELDGGDGATASEGAGGADARSLAPQPGSVPPAPGTVAPRTDGRERRHIERSASLTLAARPRDLDAVSERVQEVTSDQGG